MTEHDANETVEYLTQLWPRITDPKWGWPKEQRNVFRAHVLLVRLDFNAAQRCLRGIATRHTRGHPSMATILEALRAESQSQNVGGQYGRDASGLIQQQRAIWARDDSRWDNASDIDVMWAYARNRIRTDDPVDHALAFEFEARTLGWTRDVIMSTVRARAGEVAAKELELRWALVDDEYDAITAKKKPPLLDGGIPTADCRPPAANRIGPS